MIASEAAPSHQPGNATLHDPSLGKNGKALRRILGLWMGFDQALVASCAQTPHYLNVPPELFFNPLKKLTPVMTITPNHGKSGKEARQRLKEFFASRQVRSAGCCHLHSHQNPLGYPQASAFCVPRFSCLRHSPSRVLERHWF